MDKAGTYQMETAGDRRDNFFYENKLKYQVGKGLILSSSTAKSKEMEEAKWGKINMLICVIWKWRIQLQKTFSDFDTSTYSHGKRPAWEKDLYFAQIYEKLLWLKIGLFFPPLFPLTRNSVFQFNQNWKKVHDKNSINWW